MPDLTHLYDLTPLKTWFEALSLDGRSMLVGALLAIIVLSVVPATRALLSILQKLLLMQKTEKYGLDHVVLNLPSEPGAWMNFGYWKGLDPTFQYVTACTNAAHALGQAVGLSQGQTIMDVGFGCGDQDIYFLNEFKVKKIIGYSNSTSQVQLAKDRCEKTGEKRFLPRFGVAPHLPPHDTPFDAILSLDSAYHYNTRQEFFKTSFQNLKEGGKLGLIDLAVNEPLSLLQRLALLPLASMIGIPRSNLYSSEIYQKKMKEAGFSKVTVEAIDPFAFSHLPTFIDAQIDRFRPILSPGVINKYRFIAVGMRLLCRLKIFQLAIFVGVKETAT